MIKSNYDYFYHLIPRTDLKLNSPESALLLSDLYDEHLNIHRGNPSAKLIGAVMYSDKEDPFVCTRYETLLRDYVKCGIQTVFGLTVDEYMELPVWKLKVMNDTSLELLKDMNEGLGTDEES